MDIIKIGLFIPSVIISNNAGPLWSLSFSKAGNSSSFLVTLIPNAPQFSAYLAKLALCKDVFQTSNSAAFCSFDIFPNSELLSNTFVRKNSLITEEGHDILSDENAKNKTNMI